MAEPAPAATRAAAPAAAATDSPGMGRVGILGCGNMGAAIARGLLREGVVPASSLFLFDASDRVLDALASELGAKKGRGMADLAAACDLLVLAVKPQVFAALGAETFEAMNRHDNRILVSVMAGVGSDRLRRAFAPSWKVVRVMPNLPLAAGMGATAIETDQLDEATLARVEKVFRAAGGSVRVTASQMDAVTALSGSGPMYVFEFLEGLIQAGVKAGLPRDTAQALAVQTLKGSLALFEGASDPPAQWTARVCSPGGTTIHALHVLEKEGFKAALMSAVEAAAKRSRELGA